MALGERVRRSEEAMFACAQGKAEMAEGLFETMSSEDGA